MTQFRPVDGAKFKNVLVWKNLLNMFSFSLIPGTPTQYLNTYIYPTLLPALEAMLKQAKLEKCFEVGLPGFCFFVSVFFLSSKGEEVTIQIIDQMGFLAGLGY